MHRTLAQDIFSKIDLKKVGRLRAQKFEDAYTDASISEGSLFNLVEIRDLVMPDTYEQPRRKIKHKFGKLAFRMGASVKHASRKQKNSRRELPAVFDEKLGRRSKILVNDLAKMNIGKNTEIHNRFRIKSFLDEAVINDEAIMH